MKQDTRVLVPDHERPAALLDHCDLAPDVIPPKGGKVRMHGQELLARRADTRGSAARQRRVVRRALEVALAQPVAGVVIDGICLQVNGTKYARHFTHRSASQLGEYIHNLKLLTEEYESYAADNYWPMRESFCRFCEFKPVCRQAPEVRAAYLRTLFKQGEAWNPLKPR